MAEFDFRKKDLMLNSIEEQSKFNKFWCEDLRLRMRKLGERKENVAKMIHILNESGVTDSAIRKEFDRLSNNIKVEQSTLDDECEDFLKSCAYLDGMIDTLLTLFHK